MNTDHTYTDFVSSRAKEGYVISNELTASDCQMWHAVTGISGEAGELLDAVKKVVIYRKNIDRENIIEELGDLEFYMEHLRHTLGITRDETIEANIKKLTTRYPKTFTNQNAQERKDKA